MGIRSWVLEWLEAGRMRHEPDRRTQVYPYSYGYRTGNKQPVMKKTPANLRKLSESPIPRAAIKVIKDEVAMLDWTVTAINEAKKEKWQPICDIITRILIRPNPSDTYREWLEQIVEDMLVAGDGSSEILKTGDKTRPLRLFPVDNFSIEHLPMWDGNPNSPRYAQRVVGEYVYLKDSELMNIRMNPRSNTPFGYGFMEMVWEQVNFFLDSHKSAGNQAGNNFARRILNLGKGAGNAVDAYRVYWENEVRGRGVQPIISAEGASVLNLGATDDKALYLEWQRFLIEIVAVCAGISPKKLGQTKDVNRNTAESEDEDTGKTIRSIADKIAEHINKDIIEDHFGLGEHIQFKYMHAVSLRDQKLQADIDAIYLDRGVSVPDEVRRGSLGKEPLENEHGAVILRSSTYTVVSLGKTLEEQQARPEPEGKTKEPPEEPDPNTLE